jgi:hypothetical protein
VLLFAFHPLGHRPRCSLEINLVPYHAESLVMPAVQDSAVTMDRPASFSALRIACARSQRAGLMVSVVSADKFVASDTFARR